MYLWRVNLPDVEMMCRCVPDVCACQLPDVEMTCRCVASAMCPWRLTYLMLKQCVGVLVMCVPVES